MARKTKQAPTKKYADFSADNAKSKSVVWLTQADFDIEYTTEEAAIATDGWYYKGPKFWVGPFRTSEDAANAEKTGAPR